MSNRAVNGSGVRYISGSAREPRQSTSALGVYVASDTTTAREMRTDALDRRFNSSAQPSPSYGHSNPTAVHKARAQSALDAFDAAMKKG